MIRCGVARTTSAAEPDAADETVDIGGTFGWIHDGEQAGAVVGGDLHAGEQPERTELARWICFQLGKCLLEQVDPLTGVVIGNCDAIDAGSHEVE